MGEYNKDSIKVMSDMDHIRQRCGMYIGDTDNPRQLFSEMFDNAIDESQSGYSTLTEVHVDTKERSYTVNDHGRGIPIGLKENEDGKSIEVIQLLCTKSFSGGKFDNSNYRISSGLHGVGLGCCNALSKSFTAETRRDGKSVKLTCSEGKVLDLQYSDTSKENGCTFSIKADDSIFDSTLIPIDFIRNRCLVSNAFGYPVDLYVDGVKENLEVKSLLDLIPHEDNSTYADFIIDAKIDSGEFIRVALRYTSDTSTKSFGYTNLLFNRYGGTHTRLLDSAIENVWSEFYNESSEVALKSSDCKVGLRVICAVFINEVAFSSQTKDKLTVPNKNIQPLIDAFSEKFRQYLLDNGDIRLALIRRFAEYRISQNRLTSRKEIMELVKINGRSESGLVKRKSVVRGLIECTSPYLDGTELFICEGNSAAGTAARARNKKIQSVLPLRGKIKNISYMSITQALKSEDIRKVVNATGAGVGDETDPERCRYEKIIISCDADPDGKHITALLISLYVNLMAPLVKAGRVYVLEPPLFGYKKNGKYVFTNEFSEIPQDLKDRKGFTRYKGLGEMDDAEFRDSCMTPGARNLYRVNYPNDLDQFNRIMGTTGGRKSLLQDLGVIQYVNRDSDSDENELGDDITDVETV